MSWRVNVAFSIDCRSWCASSRWWRVRSRCLVRCLARSLKGSARIATRICYLHRRRRCSSHDYDLAPVYRRRLCQHPTLNPTFAKCRNIVAVPPRYLPLSRSQPSPPPSYPRSMRMRREHVDERREYLAEHSSFNRPPLPSLSPVAQPELRQLRVDPVGCGWELHRGGRTPVSLNQCSSFFAPRSGICFRTLFHIEIWDACELRMKET